MPAADGGWSAIRTPDQRVRVFVSSTLEELAAERRAARAAIEQLRLAPVMFETGARAHPPQEVYRAYLAQSDIFVGIYWQRYGWVGPGMTISGLEDELRLAAGMPRLLYVKVPAPGMEPGLSRMLEAIRAEGTTAYKRFSDAGELRELIASDLAMTLAERFGGPDRAAGWPAIPSPVSALVGRDADVAEVTRMLTAPGARLVVLTGVGGAGKTRLALAVAERTQEQWADGAAFVDLSPVTDPRLVPDAIASALGLVGHGRERPLDTLQRRLAREHMLLVLDNFEQVLGAAPVVADLLERTPGLRVLVTSRVVLRLRGEQEWRVDPLGVPSPESTPAALAEAPAVRGPGPGCPARLHADQRERRGGGRVVPSARRPAAGPGTRRRLHAAADPRSDTGPAARAAGAPGRRGRPARPAANADQHHPVELRPAARTRPADARAAVGVRRPIHRRRRGGGRRPGGPRRGAGSCDAAGQQHDQPGRPSRRGTGVPAARPDPPLRRRAASRPRPDAQPPGTVSARRPGRRQPSLWLAGPGHAPARQRAAEPARRARLDRRRAAAVRAGGAGSGRCLGLAAGPRAPAAVRHALAADRLAAGTRPARWRSAGARLSAGRRMDEPGRVHQGHRCCRRGLPGRPPR